MSDSNKIADFFNERARNYGDSIQSLDWGSKRTQEIRFSVMAEIGNLQNKNILDVGCGLAHFYEFLVERGINARYTGVDLSSELVNLARTKHPGLEIICADILKDEVGKFDYVFGSGIHYIKVENNYARAKEVVTKMVELSTMGVATNMISSYYNASVFADHVMAYDPGQVLSIARELAPYVSLRHDYLPNDFTVYICKKDYMERKQ